MIIWDFFKSYSTKCFSQIFCWHRRLKCDRNCWKSWIFKMCLQKNHSKNFIDTTQNQYLIGLSQVSWLVKIKVNRGTMFQSKMFGSPKNLQRTKETRFLRYFRKKTDNEKFSDRHWNLACEGKEAYSKRLSKLK